MLKLRPFQRKFIAAATAPGIDTACLSLPRGNGKSALAGHLVTRILTPTDKLFCPGTESVLCAASIEQARIVFRFARADLDTPDSEYRFLDSHNRIGIMHVPTRTRLRVIGSNGKTAMGLVGCPWAICDEPGSWETNGGQLLNDAIETAKGKPGSPLRAVYIGTLAPAMSGWWHSLVKDGSHHSTYIQALQGDIKTWDQWSTIRTCNPLVEISKTFRKKLLEERDDARRDSRLKARFLSYRLNLPSADESKVLLTVHDWERVCARPVPDREGKPIVGIDMGASRAWSTAVAIWTNGRTEAIAVCPGIPSIREQEVRDRVAANTYQKLVDQGSLIVAEGLRVPPASMLVNGMMKAWGIPSLIVCDRFRAKDLQDAAPAVPISSRITRWSESSEDIRAIRKLAKDGPLSCAPASRSLVAASLSVATVKNDDSGNFRLIKGASNNTSRDDVAIALTYAAGAVVRQLARPARRPLRSMLAG